MGSGHGRHATAGIDDSSSSILLDSSFFVDRICHLALGLVTVPTLGCVYHQSKEQRVSHPETREEQEIFFQQEE